MLPSFFCYHHEETKYTRGFMVQANEPIGDHIITLPWASFRSLQMRRDEENTDKPLCTYTKSRIHPKENTTRHARANNTVL